MLAACTADMITPGTCMASDVLLHRACMASGCSMHSKLHAPCGSRQCYPCMLSCAVQSCPHQPYLATALSWSVVS